MYGNGIVKIICMKKKLFHFDLHKLDVSFHQFISLAINNDYNNLCILTCWNGPHAKIAHFIRKWNKTKFESVNKEVH
jgi:hypothetical protein